MSIDYMEDSIKYKQIAPQYELLFETFLVYFRYLQGDLLDFLKLVDNNTYIEELIGLEPAPRNIVSPVENLFQLLDESGLEEKLTTLHTNLNTKTPLWEVSFDADTVLSGFFSAIIILSHEYKLRFTEIIEFIDFGAIDWYGWRLSENIPLTRLTIRENFTMNYNSCTKICANLFEIERGLL